MTIRNTKGAQVGAIREITFTVDFSTVPQSPGTQVLWTPPDRGQWSLAFLNWVRGSGTVVNVTAGTLTNATDHGQTMDHTYFALGDGTHLEVIMNGPYWGDSGIPFALDPGEQARLTGQTAFQWVNGFNYYFPTGISDLQGLSIDVLERVLIQNEYTTDASALWGFDVIEQTAPMTPSMTPDPTTPYLLYSRTKPLVIQYFTAPDAPPLPPDGSMTFRVVATKRVK